MQAYLHKVAARGGSKAAAPSLTGVSFGGANVGDGDFTAYFDRLVNARNVQYKYDIVYTVPCAGQITACNPLEVAVPTAHGTKTGAFAYKRVGGQVELDLPDIPVQQEQWAKLKVFTQQDFCRTQDTVLWHVDALHYCSYFCALGAYAGEASWCKLWPEAAGSEADKASYCFQGVSGAAYPKTPVFPFRETV